MQNAYENLVENSIPILIQTRFIMWNKNTISEPYNCCNFTFMN